MTNGARLAHIIATETTIGTTPIPNAIGDAKRFSDLLEHPNFGGFKLSYSFDDHVEAVQMKMKEIFHTATPEDTVLIYYSGHGFVDKKNHFRICGRDSDVLQLEPAISSNEIIEQILRSKAGSILIVLDCCEAKVFSRNFAENEISQKRLAKDDRTVQVIWGETEQGKTYEIAKRSVFTSHLMDMLVTGEAGGEKPTTSMKDLYEYSSSKNNVEKFHQHFGVYRAVTISSNPNRHPPVDERVIKDLYSDDTTNINRSLRKLHNIVESGLPEHRSKAMSLLNDFFTLKPNRPSQIRDIRDLTPVGSPVSEDDQVVKIFYHSMNVSWYRYIRDIFLAAGLRCHPIDIGFHNEKLEERDLSDQVFMSAESDNPIIWIIDPDTVQALFRRFRKARDFVEEHKDITNENMSVVWLEKKETKSNIPDLFRNCRSFQASGQDLHLLADDIVQKFGGMPARSDRFFQPTTSPSLKTCVDIDFEFFLSVMGHHEACLKNAYEAESEVKVHNPVVREPKFLLFKRGSSFVMAICDINQRIDPRSLQLSHEPNVVSSFAKEEDVVELGFDKHCVHPMFLDPSNCLARIIIDADIFFQYLMFPHSRVKLPYPLESYGDKIFRSISSFIRSLAQIHGTKLVFANIIRRKRFDDHVLKTLLINNNLSTRFAPTPSNSLHIGSLRTAMISYLFYLSKRESNQFHIRFDDTNVEDDLARQNIETILQDLSWIGIPGKNMSFRQTGKRYQKSYRQVLDLLDASGLVEKASDGTRSLKISSMRNKMSYWFDYHKGPQIRHSVPLVTPGQRKKLDYSITWPEDERFKYKFAGAVDDVLQNSLVIRDVRQDDSFFTLRQSLILGNLRECVAYPSRSLRKGLVEDIRIEHARRRKRKAPPFPFPCPPVYLHVANVCDEAGKTLSKRNLKLEHQVKHIREKGVFFPETVFAWIMLSLGHDAVSSLGFRRACLIRIVSRIGIEGFLSAYGNIFSTERLYNAQKRSPIKLSGLQRIDFEVLQNITRWRLQKFAYETLAISSDSDRNRLDSLISRLYPYRSYFQGSGEISRFLRNFVPERRYREINKGSVFRVDEGDVSKRIFSWLDEQSPEVKKQLRSLMIGKGAGPPLEILFKILGPSQSALFVDEVAANLPNMDVGTDDAGSLPTKSA